jgi:predicted outer membrane repeat protein
VSSQLSDNYAYQGGGIFAGGAYDSPPSYFQVEISSTSFHGNSAKTLGSAIYLQKLAANIEYSSISQNEVTRYL